MQTYVLTTSGSGAGSGLFIAFLLLGLFFAFLPAHQLLLAVPRGWTSTLHHEYLC